jgi:ligand-binding SRPBCC domain-containing protein
MKHFTFHHEQRFDLDLPAVFAFFSEAQNLERITPPWLNFQILTPPPLTMAVGTIIDYRLRLHSIPLRWQSEITAWEPPYRFVDEQRRGPYRSWIHAHSFQEEGGVTVVRDDVRYAVPGGRLIQRFFVEPDLRRIFAFRAQRLAELLG